MQLVLGDTQVEGPKQPQVAVPWQTVGMVTQCREVSPSLGRSVTQAWFPSPQEEQLSTLRHWVAAAQLPLKQFPFADTVGTDPAGHGGATCPHTTAEVSHANPATHRPATQSILPGGSSCWAHLVCKQNSRHADGGVPAGTARQAQQSFSSRQSAAVTHSGLPTTAPPVPMAPPLPGMPPVPAPPVAAPPVPAPPVDAPPVPTRPPLAAPPVPARPPVPSPPVPMAPPVSAFPPVPVSLPPLPVVSPPVPESPPEAYAPPLAGALPVPLMSWPLLPPEAKVPPPLPPLSVHSNPVVSVEQEGHAARVQAATRIEPRCGNFM